MEKGRPDWVKIEETVELPETLGDSRALWLYTVRTLAGRQVMNKKTGRGARPLERTRDCSPGMPAELSQSFSPNRNLHRLDACGVSVLFESHMLFSFNSHIHSLR